MKKSIQTLRTGLLTAALFCLGSAAQAITETITMPTTIGVSDTSHDNHDIIIIGAAVTINGAHPFHSLALQSGAVVTHTAALAAGMKLTVAQNVTIDASSKIDVSGQGNGVGSGPGAGSSDGNTAVGGGGYGGGGGGYGTGTGGLGYGSILQPVDLGSGGGLGYYSSGTAGGGSIRLIVGGTLQIDGSLLASGANPGYYYGGAGSGGSIYVTAGTLSGAGSIAANGGNAYGNAYGGGGGGGRIALYVTANSSLPLANVTATGGFGGQGGGAGTIYTQFGSQTVGNLIIANASAGVNTDLNGVNTVANLTVTGGAVAAFNGTTVNQNVVVNGATLAAKSGILNVAGNISLSNGSLLRPEILPSSATASAANLSLRVTGSCTVDGTSSISATGYGYGANTGPGAGSSDGNSAVGGGGYGGGGGGYGTGTGGLGYGSILQPVDLGSGGGLGYYSSGTAGGGSIRLIVGGTLQIDGSLLASGANPGYYYGGGGSGGSIYVTAGTLSGAGSIAANGGNAYGNAYGGGGGGGRIALYVTTNSLPLANITATGGFGGQGGGAGTIYTQFGSQTVGNLIIANASAGNVTDLSQISNITNLTISSNATAYYGGSVNGPLIVSGATLGILSNGLQVAGNAALTGAIVRPAAFPSASAVSQPNLALTVAGSLMEDAGSVIDATGYGYGPNSGPGAGSSDGNSAVGGGGYGGAGGGFGGGTGGAPYGSLTSPLDLGSGGGLGYYSAGAAGGGSIRLIVGGTLQIDGSLLASGANPGYYYGGAGSGGSIYVTAAALSGAGSIAANGGNAYGNAYGGGGGGGRIAIYTTTKTFPASSVSVNPRAGGDGAALGTIYYGTYNPSAPTTMITSGPAENAVVPSGLVTFTYTGSSQITPAASLHYKYHLDNGAWQGPVTQTTVSFTNLTDGPHTFYVAAIDGLGVADTAPPSRDFTIDNPPVISQILANPQDTQATITWTTDKPSSSQAAYRVAGQTVWLYTATQTTLVTAHSVLITGLTPNTNYEYEVLSSDANHSSSTSAVNTFKTKADTTPPVTTIASGPSEGATRGVASATFGFTGTDNFTTTANLKYKYKVDGGSYSAPSAATTATLTGLADGNHAFTVAAIDEAGNADTAPPVRHFTTDTLLPIIANQQSGNATDSAIGIAWNTNKPATSQVKFRVLGAVNFDSNNLDTSLVTSHSVVVYGLKPNTTYQYYVISQDSLGRSVDTSANLLTFQTLPDITKPVVGFTISPNNNGAVGPGNVVFAWQGHDDSTPDSSLTYQYSLDGAAFTPASPSNITTVTLNFPMTSPNAHTFRVQAFDALGNTSIPAAVTFTVDGTAPVFTALTASNLTFNSAQINWTTNKATTGEVQYDSGSGAFDFHFDYPPFTANHSLTIGPLGSKSSYRVRVVAKDAAGNTSTSNTITLTTLPVHDLSVAASDLSFSNPGPASGDKITMSAKIHNIGDFDETATVIFYDSTPANGNYEIGRTTVSAPSRAASDPVVTSPLFTVLEGPHKPFVQIVSASPSEDITGNNSAGTDLTVGAPANRLVLTITTPTTYPGDNSLFTVSITNTGSQPQTLSAVNLSGTAWVSLVSPVPAAPIKPGHSVELTCRLTPPTTQAGGTISSPVLVPITVTASDGAAFPQNFNVAVYSAPVSVLNVTVRDAVSGNPINGATIALDYTDKQYFTGPNGTPIDNNGNAVTIYAPSGSSAVFAIAKNYLPVSLSTDASAPVVLALQPGQALQVSQVTVTPLTQAQIIARGVNLADPVNYNIFDFVLSMKIGPLPVPNIQLPITPVTPGTTISQTYPIGGESFGGSGGGGGGGYGYGSGGGSVTLSAYYPTPDPTIHVDTWIIIPGDIRILKQFFDATVFIQNNTNFPINNVNASLTLPASGLALPDLFDSPQVLTQNLGTMAAMSKAQASWVLRGDLPGTYAVTGSATGVLNPPGGGSPIALNSSLMSGNFDVTAPKIGVVFGTPTVVYAGQDFPITITITNQCSIDLNGVRAHIKADKLVNCTLSTHQTNPTDPADATMFLAGIIPVGQSKTVTIYFTSLVTGVVEEVQSRVSDPFLEPPVTVDPMPTLPPVAVNDSISTDVNTPYTALVLANDTDSNTPKLPLTVSAFTQPAHGTVTKNADNSLTYTPANGYKGPDEFTYTASNGTQTASATVSVIVGKVTVSGNVLLQEYIAPVTGQVITLEFRPLDGTAKLIKTAALDVNGNFSVSGIPARQYNLAIKGTKWLQQVVALDASSGANISNVAASLAGGDANNDNSVDTSDFNILVGAFGSAASVPGSGYDSRADFNGDGFVDTSDFNILAGNFGSAGDP